MRRTLILSAVWAGLTGPAIADAAVAKSDKAANDAGDLSCFSAAKIQGNQAADHVLTLRQFVSTQRDVPLPIDWFQLHVGGVRNNVILASRAYAQLSATVKNHPEGAEQLAEIQQQYTDVLDICDRLQTACGEKPADLAAISRTLNELQSSLSEARALHQELAYVCSPGITLSGDSHGAQAEAASQEAPSAEVESSELVEIGG